MLKPIINNLHNEEIVYMEVLDRVRADISRHGLLEAGQRVVVGVSGGPDSIVLLHILKRLQEELKILLHVAHLNHMFRGEESQADASFVQTVCQQWGIPCSIEERDVPAYAKATGLTSQVAARRVRFQFFAEVLTKVEGQRIALAHHADDQAETILMNLFRGAGLKGLSGMSPLREKLFIRPLLHVRKKEIEQYCAVENLSYRTDSSNLKTVYRRNKLRHQLIPTLEREYAPGLVHILSRMAEQIGNEDEYLDHLATAAYSEVLFSEGENGVSLDLKNVNKQPLVLVRRLLRIAWQRVYGTKQDLSFDHVERLIEELAYKGGPEKVLELPGGVRVRFSYDRLTFLKNKVSLILAKESSPLPVPGQVNFLDSQIVAQLLDVQDLIHPHQRLPKQLAVLDAAKVSLPLIVRSRQEGDTFIPFGLGKQIKLKKLLIDCKVPKHLRDQIPIVVEQNTGRILWVAGIRPADGVGISENSKKLILLRLENGNDSNT